METTARVEAVIRWATSAPNTGPLTAVLLEQDFASRHVLAVCLLSRGDPQRVQFQFPMRLLRTLDSPLERQADLFLEIREKDTLLLRSPVTLNVPLRDLKDMAGGQVTIDLGVFLVAPGTTGCGNLEEGTTGGKDGET